ncbi:MAG TPA: ricin-type beta-trefoil lectin domain protein [Terriglobales bacterium]|nr:ricin-type beta-trefoil lectin domain protein [Terriglobales bacterium]
MFFFSREEHRSHNGGRRRHFALICLAMAMLGVVLTSRGYGQLSMLQASGTNVVNAGSQIVQLQGVNLGGWFIMEKWMSPLTSDSETDTYTVMKTLDNRFGVSQEQSLINTYQQSWITTQDLDNIAALGFNVIRVPVWYGQFYNLNNISNSGWRSDAFNELDWVVSNAAQRGIYTIIDMHGVVGGQSKSDDTGRGGQNQYWTNSNDQGNTAWMWWQIASHYKGNANVAGYDLINEPTGAPNNSAVINAYNSLYKTVRSVDPNHMIIMEGTWGQWNWSMLPNPSSQGWTNVMYEMHSYCWNCSASQIQQSADGQVSDFRNHANYNVPGYIGEFNDFGAGSSVWQYSVNAFNNAGLSWTPWTYKATHGLVPDSWGFYDPTFWPTTPNISSDSVATIASDWQQWTTANAFGLSSAQGITGGGGPPPTPGPPGSIDPNAWYEVINQTGGLCMDASGWGTSNGTLLQQWSCGNQQHNQEWQFRAAASSGYDAVFNRNAPSLVWDNEGSTANGNGAWLWTYGSGNTNQEWQPVSLGNGLWNFVNLTSGLCLDNTGSTSNGAQMTQWQCQSGNTNQEFSLVQQP